ncbi:MAG: site-specific DNA-methyltransferase, partial [Candidatus Beckwithbacteria bacterium]
LLQTKKANGELTRKFQMERLGQKALYFIGGETVMYKIEDIINKVHCADCLEFMKQMPDKCVDLALTDPPYGLGFQYEQFEDTQENLKKLVDSFMPEVLRIAKTVVLTPGINNIHLYPKPKWILCWTYSGGANYSSWGFNCWQPILVYGADPYLRDGLGARSDVIIDNVPAKDWGHPCPKPESFIKKLLVRVSTKETDLILDPFAGSGTTCVAAKHLKRNFIGVEISEKYCQIARERLRQNILL